MTTVNELRERLVDFLTEAGTWIDAKGLPGTDPSADRTFACGFSNPDQVYFLSHYPDQVLVLVQVRQVGKEHKAAQVCNNDNYPRLVDLYKILCQRQASEST